MGKSISIYVNLLIKWFIISSLSTQTQTIARTCSTVSETISREAKTKNKDYRFFREAIESSGKSTILANIDDHDFVVSIGYAYMYHHFGCGFDQGFATKELSPAAR